MDNWTYDEKAWRSAAGRGDKQLFTQSFVVAGSAGADEAHCLIDVSAGTPAEWCHKGADSGTIKIYHIYIDIDIGALTGPVIIGWVTENDGTDGSLQIVYQFAAVDQRHNLDFGDHPILCNSNHHLGQATDGSHTVLQNDANYTSSAGGTNHYPAVGDLVLLTDFAVGNFTQINVVIQYTVI